jgi:hypothetical protein
MNKKDSVVLNHMRQSAKKRCTIPNANNGRAFMSCIILDNNFMTMSPIGINKYEMTTNHGTVHAEVDALIKLQPAKKRNTIINLAVYTTSRDGNKLMMSKCCDNCIKSIQVISKRKRYTVKNIYYINENGMLDKL